MNAIPRIPRHRIQRFEYYDALYAEARVTYNQLKIVTQSQLSDSFKLHAAKILGRAKARMMRRLELAEKNSKPVPRGGPTLTDHCPRRGDQTQER